MEFIITLLIALAFNSLVIFGIQAAFDFEFGKSKAYHVWVSSTEFEERWRKSYAGGHIFGKIHYNLEWLLGETILKPLISCVVCMSSFHGFWFYWFTIEFFVTDGIGAIGHACFWVLYTLALAGLNSIVYARNTD